MSANNTTLRRLMKEAQELSPSSSTPSPHFHAHPVSDSNLFDWHFTLAGPPAPSPYAGGIYHGRIVLPPQYPLRPPSFRFLTPSGRFEVNREICLSISGHHERTWQPAWGIRTALTAIRSFMDGEPKGQVGGLDASSEARKDWAKQSRDWVCPSCAEGKTNAEVLAEWQDICREKGVDVENEGTPGEQQDGADTVPEGLKLGYRDELEKGSKPGSEQAQTPTQEPMPPQSDDDTKEIPRSVASALENLTPTANTTTETPRRAEVPAASSQSATDIRPQVPLAPRQDRTQVSVRNTPGQDEGPWLDRAIIGVICALAFVILRKVLFAPAEI
ncbi:hypothetical protein MGYG_07803 [Nannizzia gypsea CBS 118893]|uniref:UBC core domain-containing protein n=1 Tax=Arthroderma gypseum (strain ATCC MYA-4604 / CBS 118893) TaxID=535722 RepID=E4V472_ARTGP|nr:hypothetical protein MGYG_07803 [Nannizzia gypsea CBS 118893]EFR04796.1 hypothetical protein MGYG_07803 [Nannizzia gypsea CBS 118893]